MPSFQWSWVVSTKKDAGGCAEEIVCKSSCKACPQISPLQLSCWSSSIDYGLVNQVTFLGEHPLLWQCNLATFKTLHEYTQGWHAQPTNLHAALGVERHVAWSWLPNLALLSFPPFGARVWWNMLPGHDCQIWHCSVSHPLAPECGETCCLIMTAKSGIAQYPTLWCQSVVKHVAWSWQPCLAFTAFHHPCSAEVWRGI